MWKLKNVYFRCACNKTSSFTSFIILLTDIKVSCFRNFLSFETSLIWLLWRIFFVFSYFWEFAFELENTFNLRSIKMNFNSFNSTYWASICVWTNSPCWIYFQINPCRSRSRCHSAMRSREWNLTIAHNIWVNQCLIP